MKIKKIKGVKEIKLNKGYCVYFLTDEIGEILYIGKSELSTLGRVAAHSYNKKFAKVYVKEVFSKEEMDMTEARMILEIMPPLNNRIEMRKEMGYVSVHDIKMEVGVSIPIIKKVAKKAGLNVLEAYNKTYYPIKVKQEILNFITENEKLFKNRPISLVR